MTSDQNRLEIVIEQEFLDRLDARVREVTTLWWDRRATAPNRKKRVVGIVEGLRWALKCGQTLPPPDRESGARMAFDAARGLTILEEFVRVVEPEFDIFGIAMAGYHVAHRNETVPLDDASLRAILAIRRTRRERAEEIEASIPCQKPEPKPEPKHDRKPKSPRTAALIERLRDIRAGDDAAALSALVDYLGPALHAQALAEIRRVCEAKPKRRDIR